MNTTVIEEVMTDVDLQNEYGRSRYSKVMGEFHKDARRLFGLSDAQAKRAAHSLGSDLGRSQTTGIKIGSVTKKDALITVKDVGGYKGPITNSIRLAKACALLNEAAKYGITISGERGIEFQPLMNDWLNETSLAGEVLSESK